MYYTIVNQLLDRAVRANELLTKAAIPYQFVGGFAVFLRVRAVDEDAARTTSGIDIEVNQSDLAKVQQLDSIGNLLRAYSTDCPVTPEIIDGFCVAPITELLRQRLTRNRFKDMMYTRDMLNVGLITPEMEAALSAALRERLDFIKAHE